ncbi:hypothetical protein [Microbacterium paraoxydans]|uniref:hypothetical protein n=1 Tax=Microbacterium paraoxydans TaxID=199592 RepID=UPI003D71EEC3
MRHRPLLALAAITVLLLTGCAPEPEPTETSTPSPSASPTPTAEPIVAPTPAFDVTCNDVAAEMATATGSEAGAVAEVLGVWSAPNWYPGPAQHMFQRAGGIACSAGTTERNWEVSMAPGAAALTAGAESRGGYAGEEARCEVGGYCFFQVVEGDVLVSGAARDEALGPDDAEAIEAGLRRLGAAAAASLRDVETTESEIVGVECARLLTDVELGEELGAEVHLINQFGGWSIPSEVYQTINGSRICYYASGEDEYSAQGYLMLTSLPGGAWAFERIEGEEPVEVAGADAALTGVDEQGRTVLDVVVGTDWLRLTTFQGSGISDLAPLATTIVENFGVSRPGGQ